MGCCSWLVSYTLIRLDTRAVFEEGPGCGHLEQKPDGQGASMEAG